jgi:5-methylcytosine-specific restriction endonuclease McrA
MKTLEEYEHEFKEWLHTFHESIEGEEARYLSEEDRTQVLEDYGYKCQECGMTQDEHIQEFGESLHLDHNWPFSKGGPTEAWNMRPLCRKCNLKKSNKWFW